LAAGNLFGLLEQEVVVLWQRTEMALLKH